MDLQIVKTQINMGKECLIVDGYTFRRDSILKSGEISWCCSLNRQKCKVKIRTDADSTRILSGTLDHNHTTSDRSLERKLVRNRVKLKATEDISSRPAKIIKNELFASNEENLKPSDITSLRQALYRERRKKFPKLPSSIEEVSDVLNFWKPINTSMLLLRYKQDSSHTCIIIQLVNFVCHDIHRSLILIIVIKTTPFLYFLIRPNVYIFNAPLYCFLSPHFIKICPNIKR
jgi:hypothetical protein